MMNLWLPSTVNDLKATVMTVTAGEETQVPQFTRSEQGPAGGIVTRAFAMGGFVTADNPGIVWAMLLTAGGLPM